MNNTKVPEVKTVRGSSGMEYVVKKGVDKQSGNPIDKVQPGEINGTPLTPIYEGD